MGADLNLVERTVVRSLILEGAAADRAGYRLVGLFAIGAFHILHTLHIFIIFH
jgi:hypothetical protein